MWTLVFMNLIAGTIYHTAHCIGHQPWADRVFMKYDVATVAATAIGVFIEAPSSEKHTVVLVTLLCFVLWLLTFSILRGIPFNPILSVLHGCGAAIHVHIARRLGCDVAEHWLLWNA